MRSPDHHRLFIHQPDNRQFPHVPHQFRRLLPSALARNASFDAKQRMGLVFTLVERGLAYGGFLVRFVSSQLLITFMSAPPDCCQTEGWQLYVG
ncbi:hypothetical protein D3C79_830710 [compost metagenome]